MKLYRGSLLSMSLSLVSLLFALSPAFAGDDLLGQLKSDYQGKTLTLRHFYKGDRLAFQADGVFVGKAVVGPWTVDGRVEIMTIELHDRMLTIRGRRVCLVFDKKGKPYRDVLEFLEESDSPDKEKLEGAFRAKDVDIEVRLNTYYPDMKDVTAAMNAVFLAPDESIGRVAPDFWRDYLENMDGLEQKAAVSSEPVYNVKPGVVSAPRLLVHKEPEFSDEARKAKYQGTATLSMVATASGEASDVQVQTPLGLGLDEKAVEAVRKWKFEPAQKDGKAVAVKLMVEVDFHLY